jgi:hypothetical protein
MITIDEEQTISINRGDSCTIALTIPLSEDNLYQFNQGDIITFRVFEKNGYDKEKKLEKKFTVAEETDKVNIVLAEEDTLFVEATNKPQTYWYEITLNEDKTIVGYDEDGAKRLIIYPADEGGDE